MRREEVRIEDDRYLIYYWFDDERSSSPSDQRELKIGNKVTETVTRSSASEDEHQRQGKQP